MSLINKMLQDLDARGGDGARAGASAAMRPVSHGGRAGLSPAAIGGAVLALAVLGGGAFAAWKYFRGGPQPVSTAAAPHAPQAVPAQQVPQQSGAAVPAGGALPVAPAGEGLVSRMEERNAEARRAATASDGAAARRRPVRETEAAPVATRAPVSASSRAAAPGLAAAKRKSVAAGAAAPAGAAAVQGDAAEPGLSSQQKAENEYRRALAKLQDARVSEAIAGLEQAVYLYPRHDAARQTLVSLLIEAGRTQEAIRHLTFATSLDPRQATMAMLLARLQLENGGNALDTLQRSLPYAESNPEYRALMAGILQRANRHKEAADHYQAAVRLQPGNGVWWMGLGISLQAEKRIAEAKIAFQRARDSGRLAPELQAFVERRLQQLN